MSVLESVVWGVIQGVTEFVPVSSDGHLAVIPLFFGMRAPGLPYTIALHMGTLVAVAVYFRKDIAAIISLKDKRMLGLMSLATLPLIPAGLIFADRIEPLFNDPGMAGLFLMINGLVLFAGHAGSLSARPRSGKIAPWQALAVGMAQPFAMLPGISRSGSTIAAGCLAGLDKEEAFRFSFLLLLPAALAAFVYSAVKAYPFGGEILSAGTVIATAVSAAVGFAALGLLRFMIKRSKLYVLGIYCLILGAVTLWAFR